jgi:hypothetical protein
MGKAFHVTGVAEGAGMVRSDMATMLSYIQNRKLPSSGVRGNRLCHSPDLLKVSDVPACSGTGRGAVSLIEKEIDERPTSNHATA